MRQVSFAGLHRILHLVASHPNGLRAKDLDTQIKSLQIYHVRQEATPAATTLYHCRNTLLHISAIKHSGQLLVVNSSNRDVAMLLDYPASDAQTLSAPLRDAFANLVLKNRDCRQHFFGLFVQDQDPSIDKFRRAADTVAWRRIIEKGRRSDAFLQNERSGQSLKLYTHSELNAVLYGLRYWARDELLMIDEFLHPTRGIVMYPILNESGSLAEVVSELVDTPQEEQSWTTLSVADLIGSLCERRHRPIKVLFSAIGWLSEHFSGHFVLIPTSRSFATINTYGVKRDELALRSYFRDTQGRYVSHVRFHKSIRRLLNDHATQRTGT